MAEEAGQAVQAIGAAASIGVAVGGASPTHRQCTIEISNECDNFSLSNPRMYIESGQCAIPPLSFIGPSRADAVQFVKTPSTACGSVGVFTYDLLKKGADKPKEKIAVMFSVPFNFNFYSNVYAMGIFDMSTECDRDLYSHMYNDNPDKSFVRGYAKDQKTLIYKCAEKSVKIMAVMSDAYHPVIKLQVMNLKQ